MMQQSKALCFISSFAVLAACQKHTAPQPPGPGTVPYILNVAREQAAEETCLISKAQTPKLQVFYGDAGVMRVVLDGHIAGTIIMPDNGPSSDHVARYVGMGYPIKNISQDAVECSRQVQAAELRGPAMLYQTFPLEIRSIPANKLTFEANCIGLVSQVDNLHLAIANDDGSRYNVILNDVKVGELWRWTNSNSWVRVDGSSTSVAGVEGQISEYDNLKISTAAKLCGQLLNASDFKTSGNISVPLPPGPYYRPANPTAPSH